MENAKRSELENVDPKSATDLNRGVDPKNAIDATTQNWKTWRTKVVGWFSLGLASRCPNQSKIKKEEEEEQNKDEEEEEETQNEEMELNGNLVIDVHW